MPASLHLSPRFPATPAPDSPRAAELIARFGITPRHTAPLPPPPATLDLSPSRIILITGPSGSGKSTLLRHARARLLAANTPHHLLTPPPPDTTPVIDALPAPTLDLALAALARAGLSDIPLLLRPLACLSEGQRTRFALAAWYASDIPLLLADEFTANLDRLTAAIVAYHLRKAVTATARTALLATTHDDLLPHLVPDHHIPLPLT